MFRLDGKVAVITGGARGIGAGVTHALAAAGARTAVVDRDPVRAGSPPGRTMTVQADVADAAQVEHAFAAVHDAWGAVDILINNAGVAAREPFEDITSDSWDAVFAVNTRGAFLCAQTALRYMRHQRGGRIVQIASVTAHQGALLGHAHYAASKSAQLGLTKTLSRVCAPFGVTANAIAPGVIRTELSSATLGPSTLAELGATIPLGLGSVDDVAHAAVYLASDEARYVTGITLDVNGGQYLR
ncbi:SDR family NAD(P)-dependent oxidoreductase [Jiangella muralis]|uniref:SDR family NAD(P)-dependent oxidoreductase n=1 Tax=Jiangella muralis TaxID=702383 RepID=UPI00069E907A|nr:SDR family NAD(P)-dependent oxidoreductase [Jiangella muralis]